MAGDKDQDKKQPDKPIEIDLSSVVVEDRRVKKDGQEKETATAQPQEQQAGKYAASQESRADDDYTAAEAPGIGGGSGGRNGGSGGGGSNTTSPEQAKAKPGKSLGERLIGMLTKEKLKRAGTIALLVGSFYFGGKYMSTIEYYVTGTAIETYNTFAQKFNSARVKSIEKMQQGMEPGKGYTIVMTDRDIVDYFSRMVEEGRLDRKTRNELSRKMVLDADLETAVANDIFNYSKGKADQSMVRKQAAETTYKAIKDGRFRSEEGLFYLRDAIDEQISPESLDEEALEDIMQMDETDKVKAMRMFNDSIGPQVQSQFIVYAVSRLDDRMKDETIIEQIPQMTLEGKERLADQIATEIMESYKEKIKETCGGSEYCVRIMQGVMSLEKDFKGLILEQIESFNTFSKY